MLLMICGFLLVEGVCVLCWLRCCLVLVVDVFQLFFCCFRCECFGYSIVVQSEVTVGFDHMIFGFYYVLFGCLQLGGEILF